MWEFQFEFEFEFEFKSPFEFQETKAAVAMNEANTAEPNRYRAEPVCDADADIIATTAKGARQQAMPTTTAVARLVFLCVSSASIYIPLVRLLLNMRSPR